MEWEYTSYLNETPGLDFNVMSVRDLFGMHDMTYDSMTNMLYGLRMLGKNSKNLVKTDLVNWAYNASETETTIEHEDIWAPYEYTFTPDNYLECRQNFSIKNPVLWNGRKNPHLYNFHVSLIQDGRTIDNVLQKTGFRYFDIGKSDGFSLNGEYLDLYGFGKHEDIEGKGSAMKKEDIADDFKIIEESGATAVRMTHYPHSDVAYDICDSLGLVVWTEIPNVGPGGFLGPGYFPTAEFQEHLRTVLKEMIRQKYNHPSVIFWGLFNELNFNYDCPVAFMNDLNIIAKQEDPSRKTAFAHCSTALPTLLHITNTMAGIKDMPGIMGNFSTMSTLFMKSP